MAKKTVRVILDVLLSAMIVFEMLIQYTGWFLHEVIGFAFFATVVIHLALSAKWMKSTAHAAKTGKLRGRTIALAVIGCLLAVAMIVLGVSSVAISGILSEAGLVWTLGSYATWTTVHAVSSYTLSALVVVHLGMHWAFLASAFKVPYNPARRRAIGAGVNAIAAVGAAALCVMAARELLPQALASAAVGQSQKEPFASASDISYSAPTPTSSDAAPGAQDSTSQKRTRKHSKGVTEDQPASKSFASEEPTPNYYEEPSYEEPTSSSSQEVVGYCPLCHKHCPLSAPQCDKPFQAGLI